MCHREARVWDLRTATKPSPKPVCHLAHPKGLTSAFYSSRGSYLLTTCNDDRLRVYDVRHVSTNRPPVIASTKHNNHTGRWLSTFKARWHPQREDTFIVGSMELPKAIEVYGIHGQKMIRLQSTANLTTICSACVFHPSQLLVAGANSSGKVHVFL
uniref:WD repeat-containing protein 76 n=1 Tax=Timema monikensis TaxID=170555 RepID=A0A7R9EN19_9NEOP|nr:unnamed protein product [Timema monikensis]